MPYWMALIPGPQPLRPSRPTTAPSNHLHGIAPDINASDADDADTASRPGLAASALGWWCLQFTPRVALLDEAVVMEVRASQRLFGGAKALRNRIAQEAYQLGCPVCACASTASAALALARARRPDAGAASPVHVDAITKSLPALLNPLPLSVLPGVAIEQATLARLGCRTLGDLRRLPRGGLSRRFGSPFLAALDQAYGERPETFNWLTMPSVFDARLELPGRIESAAALIHAANHLIPQLCAWLAGRHAGLLAFTLRWRHDFHRRDTSPEGELTVRLGNATRDADRLSRLLAEHLQHARLAAPVGDISLHVNECEPLAPSHQSLFQEWRPDALSARPDALLTPASQRAQRESLTALLERLAARLGPDRVQQAIVQADHRLERTQAWVEAKAFLPAPTAPMPIDTLPQPSWVLPQPLLLSLASDGPGLREKPVYQGRLQLLAGPHRVETAWWDTQAAPASAPDRSPAVIRDYYLASSKQAGLLWIFRERRAPDDTLSPWFLHGIFA